jgi:hypothetical protein
VKASAILQDSGLTGMSVTIFLDTILTCGSITITTGGNGELYEVQISAYPISRVPKIQTNIYSEAQMIFWSCVLLSCGL